MRLVRIEIFVVCFLIAFDAWADECEIRVNQAYARKEASSSADRQIAVAVIGQNGTGIDAVDRAAKSWGSVQRLAPARTVAELLAGSPE